MQYLRLFSEGMYLAALSIITAYAFLRTTTVPLPWNTGDSGIAFFIIKSNNNVSSGITLTNIQPRLPPITNVMTIENTSINGQRTAMRIIIMYENCTFVTSVVMRVTSDGVENLSIFSNEKSCIL